MFVCMVNNIKRTKEGTYSVYPHKIKGVLYMIKGKPGEWYSDGCIGGYFNENGNLEVVDKVKLSKWVKKKDRKVGEAEAYCLTCGREVVYQVINNRYQFENYCPHCGARMDKE